MAIISAVVAATLVILVAAMTFTFVALASTTVLIMGGTGHPLSTPPDTIPYVRQYMSEAVNNFVSPAATAPALNGIPQGPYNSVAVITPEENWPNYGRLKIGESIRKGGAALHSCLTSSVCDYNKDVDSAAPSVSDTFIVFGYSQSATIALLEKQRLAAEYAEGEGPNVVFVVIGAPRPNGGLSSRDTTGIVTFLLFGRWPDQSIPVPISTDTRYLTVNIALQYDGFSDFPLNPLNLLATLNAYMGITQSHGSYGSHSLSDPGVLDQGQYGDTRYYLIPADVLPLLKPVQRIPFIGHALADTLDPVLRVIIESAYDRSVSPGVRTPFNVFYFENPIEFAKNIVAAIPVGVDNGIETILGFRPFGTRRPGAFGVGGEEMNFVGSGSAPVEATESASESSAGDDTDVADPDVDSGAANVLSGGVDSVAVETAESMSESSAGDDTEVSDPDVDSETADVMSSDEGPAAATTRTDLSVVPNNSTISTTLSRTNINLRKFMPHRASSTNTHDSDSSNREDSTATGDARQDNSSMATSSSS
ncbi:PE-PPE domain-containing protein [Mycolicibacterium holsaticum]|uniref:PE-PPE domain-containing protein n=1 Tax=Mycolicibacterium holsaticum TaxID=152142 RepID=UPI001E5D53D7|nr:PE-PPE domain-containing protein [Mycolicibacterium holsaticum]MDA4110863.1 hypothetical protein [Mycolicibacterium holsaticum DSM 44478 = JCM 12374]